MSKVPNVVLNNGEKIPILGLGTWGSPPGEVAQAVKDAIDVGYRNIDCAHVYGNEDEVGDGLAAKIAEGVIKREDIFITSKLWNTFHRPDLVRPAIETTLKNLKLSYVDLYLMHWPMAYKEEGELFPKNEKGDILFSDVDYVDTWKEMEKTVQDGLVKSIGLSNFNSKQIERILSIAKIKPVMNQVECHPYLNQTKLDFFCNSKGIKITAYSPLGSPARPWVQANEPVLLQDPAVVKIADKYKRSVAQILLRWQIQIGHIAIPKSTSRKRIEENFNIFDFELAKEDVVTLNALNRNERFVPITSAFGHPHHPFENDDF